MSIQLFRQISICILGIVSLAVNGQDIPVFSQKLTDGFLINPALTGASGGSITASYLKQWQAVSNSPQTTYLSAHYLTKNDNLGLGVNGYFEKTNQFKTSQLSVSSAYHMSVSNRMRLSFGLSAEYRTARLNMEDLFVQDPDDPLLLGYDNENHVDFSAGINLSHPSFDIGFAAQRLSNLIGNNEEATIFNSQFTGYLNYYLPMRDDNDLFEPRILYRKQIDGITQLDALLFYTINNEFILGLNYRTSNIFGSSLGYIYKHRYVLGYSLLSGVGEGGRDLGLTHEVVLRFNMNKQYFSHYNPELNEPKGSFTNKKKRN